VQASNDGHRFQMLRPPPQDLAPDVSSEFLVFNPRSEPMIAGIPSERKSNIFRSHNSACVNSWYFVTCTLQIRVEFSARCLSSPRWYLTYAQILS